MKPATTAAMTRPHGTITHAIFFVYHQSSAATNAGFDRRCSSLTRGRCCAEALVVGDIVNENFLFIFSIVRLITFFLSLYISTVQLHPGGIH